MQGRDTDELGKTARVEVGALEQRIHRRAAPPRVVRTEIRHMVGKGHPLPNSKTAHPIPHRCNGADYLVAQGNRFGDAGVIDLHEVGAADATATETDKHLARGDGGHRSFDSFKHAGRSTDQLVHRL